VQHKAPLRGATVGAGRWTFTGSCLFCLSVRICVEQRYGIRDQVSIYSTKEEHSSDDAVNHEEDR
jgi:hypothetical protein